MSGPPRHHRERCCSSPASPAARSLDRRFSPSPPTRTPQPTAETTPHTRADHRPRSFAAPEYPSSPRSTALREGQAVCRSHSPLAHSVGSGRTESPLALPRTRVQLHEAGPGVAPSNPRRRAGRRFGRARDRFHAALCPAFPDPLSREYPARLQLLPSDRIARFRPPPTTPDPSLPTSLRHRPPLELL